jgi:3',5'-nucleoside bisphosphate phosphatase
MMGVCKNLNIKYSSTLSIKDKYFATQVMHSDLRKYPENERCFSKEVWESLNAFYRTCVNNEDSPFFLDQTKNYPTVQEAASLIKESGGKAFLAHLYVYFSDDYDELLNSIVSLNALDGIECYHSLHTLDKTEFLINFCSRKKLYVSGGSDYHGKIKPNVKIGEAFDGVRILYEVSKPWLSEYLT